MKKYKTIIPLARMVLKIIVANWLEDGVQIRPSSFQTGEARRNIRRQKVFLELLDSCHFLKATKRVPLMEEYK